ncbi:hypothetical protein AK812_SmicGene8785 [Symbiodinium microadriaticum]|uniref:Uncharacterized protein n=1 Tax=Symbiodinium microadriaticum TaxID=2951 RepID=A0A1Q9EK29_SYMMI|nr:hypothetical protein AK812_SmicGene8785 [Symbiodinium microadriaticum]
MPSPGLLQARWRGIGAAPTQPRTGTAVPAQSSAGPSKVMTEPCSDTAMKPTANMSKGKQKKTKDSEVKTERSGHEKKNKGILSQLDKAKAPEDGAGKGQNKGSIVVFSGVEGFGDGLAVQQSHPGALVTLQGAEVPKESAANEKTAPDIVEPEDATDRADEEEALFLKHPEEPQNCFHVEWPCF